MSRTARIATLAAVASCLTVGTMPALAQTTDTTKVTYTVPNGTRQFEVTEVNGTTQLQDFIFDSSRQKPFRTIVKDVNRSLLSDGYQVSAKMTNLYLVENGVYDYANKVPSKALSLTYGTSPLAGTSTLPVIPKINLSGTLGTCADAAVASALGLAAPLAPVFSLTDPLFLALSPLLQTVCNELRLLDSAARTVDVTVDGAVESITAALPLSQLPFTLSGGEGGSFTNPAYDGPIASGDSAGSGAAAATTKRLMTGTPLLSTVADPRLLLSTLTTALAAAVPTTLITGDNTGAATVTQALAAIAGENAPLVSTISKLDAAGQLALVNLLTDTLQAVDVSALTTVTSQYDAYPILQVEQFAGKQGNYDGTLVVDFFETGS